MPRSKDQLHKDLSDAVLDMEEEKTVSIAKTIVENRMDAYQAIENGLSDGMNRAGRLYEEEEYFIPELLLCSDAMYAGLDVLRPHLKVNEEAAKQKVVIGVVEGDTHDIGKNLVKIMFETSGFDVVDLGRDVPPKDFVEKAKEIDARIIALSTLMTTTMNGMKEVIALLEKENIRDRFKVMVGGGPISQGFAERIGADGYAANASEAAKLARKLVEGLIHG
ncbi:methylmalonyl-CoA mutase C-terminal domain-containing protein/methyltransferase cognate corrinoid proteins [Syntrophus gentianae]|uniref:Methylmalonyl-CoA mutase C-terminal domain-containing protein/methyltransferase cognate corrinoid proteins n=1 Tax=Syntrophus gentianae TaxID=43775 RepID=A0A1H8ACL4_9BACT|nr:corrinoid protein [Syntrophus gentianae]SEM68293.1 methylmalonyl-CoA mutase C-terminal domain-containing protein/methyltransferase cognate corrinoid proteins [Syntrophus gentianae]